MQSILFKLHVKQLFISHIIILISMYTQKGVSSNTNKQKFDSKKKYNCIQT